MNRKVPLFKAAQCRAGLSHSAALALCFVLLVPGAARAQTARATAQATIVEPLGLVKVQDLRFGRIAASATAGTVTVNADTGACTASGGVIATGGRGFGQFAGQGTKKFIVRVQIPASVTLTGPAGSTMVVGAIVLGAAPDLAYLGVTGGTPRYQISSSNGIFTFRLGGRLGIAANQRPGQYSGTYSVTVQYQ